LVPTEIVPKCTCHPATTQPEPCIGVLPDFAFCTQPNLGVVDGLRRLPGSTLALLPVEEQAIGGQELIEEVEVLNIPSQDDPAAFKPLKV
jgi:hypothetical protein